MKISVIGTGKTGSSVANLLGEDALTFNKSNPPDAAKLTGTDVAIIFVPPDAAELITEVVLDAGIPAVWGTTGYKWPHNLPLRVKERNTKWVIGTNFSMGMNLVRKAIQIFGSGSRLLKDAEFHIHEVHHTGKKDAPSGTALSWNEWLGREASISSDRLDDIKGIHSLHIKTENESILLKHEAHTRDLFAEGAIWTARFLMQHPHIDSGVYSFSSIFDRAFREEL